MKVAEHLRAMHESAAAHHVALAKAHQKLSKCFSKLAGLAENDGMPDHAEQCNEIAGAYQECCSAHTDAASSAVDMAKAVASMPALKVLDSAQGDTSLLKLVSRGNEIEPLDISAIIPDAPPAASIRAVPRVGQRQPAPAAANVAVEFSHLVKLDD